MKTILVIAYHYPPENSSCSEKNVRIVKRLLYEGYKVRVLTCNYTDEVFTEGNLAVYHTKSGLFHKDIVSCSNASVPCIDISNNKRLKDRIKSFLSGIAIPDATFDWNYEAIKFIKHNKSILSNVDLIYSISSPYSAHLLSYRISKMIKVPFIMCYGDPWIYEPKRKRGPLRYSIEKRMEGRLIDSAAGVSLITEWNRKEYIKLYGIPNDKINTYLIGFDRKNECKPLLDNKKHLFSMLYGGSLDPVHRNVIPFLEAMKSINNVHVDIYNNDYPSIRDAISQSDLESKVSIHNLISGNEFEELQNKYDALILFGNKTPYQIPGKVFTYISTGKTVLYIKNNSFEDDGAELVLRKYGNAVIVQNETNAIVDALNNYIESHDYYSNTFNIDEFNYINTMQPLVEMVNKVFKENEIS